MSRPNNFLVREHFDRPLGELSEENHAVNGKGRKPFIDGIDMGFPLAGRGRDVKLFAIE